MDKELYEQVNPVPKTAVATLIQLAGAGYEKSEEILRRLGFQKKDYAWSLGDRDELEKICMVTNRESRYVALNNVALESCCDIIYDLPCGFVHRAFDMADKGKTYVGGDLPEVIQSVQPVISRMLTPEQKCKVRFAEVDITNYQSVTDALEGLEGSVCVCTEGLLVYLNASERETVIRNIYRLLRDRGGCWITVDPETVARHMAVFTAIAGDRASAILKKEMSGFSQKSEIDIATSNAQYLQKDSPSEEDGTESERQYLQNGFLVEKIPFTRGDYELRSFAFLQPEVVDKLKKALSGIHVWKLIPDPDFVPKETEESAKNFSFRTKISKDTLHIVLSGRMDSLSAPSFLKAWEEKEGSEEFHRVEIDCKNLQYISSAGLRVLMMMKKALPGEPIVLLNVTSEVREVLTTTGFADFFQFEAKT